MATLTHDTRRTDAGAGVLFALLAASAAGLSGPLGRGLMDAGWSAGAAVSIRVLIGGAVLVPFAAVQLRGRWYLVRRHLPAMLLFGAFGVAGCQLAYFNAVARMPVGVALMIEFMSPVAVVAWMWLRHGQRPTRLTAGGAALAVAGLLVILDPSGAGTSVAGVLWALCAMVGGACFFVMTARPMDGLPGTAFAVGGLLVGGTILALAGAVGIVPFVVTTTPVAYAPGTVDWWVPIAVMGVVTAALAYVVGIAAARRLGARLASFVGLSEVLAALIFAAALLGQAPAPVQLLGGVAIVAGVIVVRRGEPVA